MLDPLGSSWLEDSLARGRDWEGEISEAGDTVRLKQIMDEQSKALAKCGKDGRQQAGVLEAAAQQAQAKQ